MRDITEITLEAHYMNRNVPSDKLTLVCQSISELEPIYFPDQRGMDGAVARSLKEPRSLLVKGIDTEELEALKWIPTDLSFTDRQTGLAESFPIGRISTQGPDTAIFPLVD